MTAILGFSAQLFVAMMSDKTSGKWMKKPTSTVLCWILSLSRDKLPLLLEINVIDTNSDK